MRGKRPRTDTPLHRRTMGTRSRELSFGAISPQTTPPERLMSTRAVPTVASTYIPSCRVLGQPLTLAFSRSGISTAPSPKSSTASTPPPSSTSRGPAMMPCTTRTHRQPTLPQPAFAQSGVVEEAITASGMSRKSSSLSLRIPTLTRTL